MMNKLIVIDADLVRDLKLQHRFSEANALISAFRNSCNKNIKQEAVENALIELQIHKVKKPDDKKGELAIRNRINRLKRIEKYNEYNKINMRKYRKRKREERRNYKKDNIILGVD